MSFLRRIPTRRLIALCASFVLAAAAGTAIALAAGSSVSPPPAKPLAAAIHDAVAAAPVQGVSARIRFTNHLIDGASLPGNDPVLTGASGRLWATADGRARLELQGDQGSGTGDVQVTLDGDRLAVYDSQQRTVYRMTLPRHSGEQRKETGTPPSVARIQRELTRLATHLDLSGAQPGAVAGRPAYTVRVTPKHDGGLLGGAELAWDADHGIPLRAAVYAAGRTDPVLDLAATEISFGRVDPAQLMVTPPPGTKTVTVATPAPPRGGEHARHVDGLSAVAQRVHFNLSAPRTLVGLPRTGVSLVDGGGEPGALVTYGRGLSEIVVIQTPIQQGERKLPESLPKVSINGATGTELDTALGTVVHFERAGVAYTVLGSVPPAAADAPARGL